MVCVDLEKSQEKTEGGQMLLLLCISAIRRIKCDRRYNMDNYTNSPVNTILSAFGTDGSGISPAVTV